MQAARHLTTQSELMNRAMRAVYRVEAGGRLSASTNTTSLSEKQRREDPFRDPDAYNDNDSRRESEPRWEDREFQLPPSEPSIVSMYARDQPRNRFEADRTTLLSVSELSFPSTRSGWHSPTQSERDGVYQSRWSQSTSQVDRTISLDMGQANAPPVPNLPALDRTRNRL